MQPDLIDIMTSKGWTKEEVAARWGITERRVRQMFKENTQRQRDSFVGLPEKEITNGK